MPSSEPFPIIPTNTAPSIRERPNGENPRIWRRSSGFGGEIRVEAGAPALITSDLRLPSARIMEAQRERDRNLLFSATRKMLSLFRQWKWYSLKHTWFGPLTFITIFLSLFALNPTSSNPIHHFIFLSYQIPNEDGDRHLSEARPQYGKGLWDIAFVTFYTIVLSFTREFIMQEFLQPLARRTQLKSRAKQFRFMEQAYTAIYFAVLGPFGLYVMKRTPVWYFNVAGMYEDYPHRTHDAAFKFYYLFQAAYWAQQAIVMMIGMEKPRKDFKELIAHHVITLTLIALSYRFHFTYMGLAIYITHDISDFFLATSKLLNYINHPLVGPYFIFFMCTWLYLRHYLNILILISEFYEFKTVGPYMLDWENEQFKCLISHVISTFLLGGLQMLNLVWLGWVLRTAWRYVWLDVKEDDRSDDDEKEWREEMREEVERRAREEDLLRAEQEMRTRAAEKKVVLGSAKVGKKRSKMTRRKLVADANQHLYLTLPNK